jgi:hypothetical protein
MATRKQVTDRVAALGCTIDEMDAGFNVDTPRGKVHAGSGTHTFAYAYRGWARPDLYDAVLSDLEPGLDDCEAGPECDSCSAEWD